MLAGGKTGGFDLCQSRRPLARGLPSPKFQGLAGNRSAGLSDRFFGAGNSAIISQEHSPCDKITQSTQGRDP